MQDLTGGKEQVQTLGQTVRDLINQLEQEFPGLEKRLCEGNRLRSGVAVSVDGVISPDGLRTRLDSSSEIHFLPAISGGLEHFNRRPWDFRF